MTAAAAMLVPKPVEVHVESALLGPLTVPDAQIFEFDLGLLGFPEAHRFALVPTRRSGTFWLQSADFDALAFLVADPFRVVEGYSVELGAAELGTLAPRDPCDVLVLAILTLPRTPDGAITANLQGPVALNLKQRKGRQVVLQDPSFRVRHPVRLTGRS
ncbi:MAG: hypothetical protein FIA95_14925 [Gemmatimonadetes bacterium]|nr:hypothetical protein [Gemmatimonadota bacterium]